jgi:hypothetical protein
MDEPKKGTWMNRKMTCGHTGKRCMGKLGEDTWANRITARGQTGKQHVAMS